MYLASTLVATLERSRTMVLMAPHGDDRNWPLYAGVFSIVFGVLGTVVATAVLFIENTAVEDMLLNCIALNFLPDVDIAMVKLLRLGDSSLVTAAKSKLSEYAAVWKRSDERNELSRLLSDPFSPHDLEKSMLIKIFTVGDKIILFIIAVAAVGGAALV